MVEAPLPSLATPKELAAASRSLPHKPAQTIPTNAMSNIDSAKPPDHDDDAMSVDSSKHPDDAMDIDLPIPAPPTAPVVPMGQSHPVEEPQRPLQPGTLQPRNAPDGQRPRPRPKKPKPPPSLFIPKKVFPLFSSHVIATKHDISGLRPPTTAPAPPPIAEECRSGSHA